ncbi:hypothetical protein ACTWPT_13500 [Nonomuraea sp. 3N208]
MQEQHGGLAGILAWVGAGLVMLFGYIAIAAAILKGSKQGSDQKPEDEN